MLLQVPLISLRELELLLRTRNCSLLPVLVVAAVTFHHSYIYQIHIYKTATDTSRRFHFPERTEGKATSEAKGNKKIKRSEKCHKESTSELGNASTQGKHDYKHIALDLPLTSPHPIQTSRIIPPSSFESTPPPPTNAART